jgi:hypothetical protein
MNQYCDAITKILNDIPFSTPTLINIFGLTLIFWFGEWIGQSLGKSLYFFLN